MEVDFCADLAPFLSLMHVLTFFFPPPAGNRYEMKVPRIGGKKRILGRLRASDADAGASGLVRYRVRSGSGSGVFGVDATTGAIRRRQRAPLQRDR